MPELGVGIHQYRRRSNGVFTDNVQVDLPPVVVGGPLVSGTPQVGQDIVLAAMTTLPAADTFQQRWLRNGIEISGAQAPIYTLTAADDQTTLVAEQRARLGSGLWTQWEASQALEVLYAPATVSSGLPDLVYAFTSGDQTVDASVAFEGALGGVWSVTGANAQISGAGLVTIPTDTLLSDVSVTVNYTNSGGGAEATFLVNIAEIETISAVVQPAIALLYDGQSLADMPDFAQMIAPDNFSSSGSTIADVSVTVSRDGDTDPQSSINTPWSTGDVVSFAVTVTDGMGRVRTFAAAEFQVVYRATYAVNPVDNTFSMAFNPLVPDTETAPLVVSGLGAMNGTYLVRKSDTLVDISFVLEGSITPDFDGDIADLGEGDVITLNSGLWFAPPGRTLSFEKQAQVNGVNVGVAGDTYTLTADDLGQSLRIRVMADDGVDAPVEAFSTAFDVPGAAIPQMVVTRVGSAAVDGATTQTIDVSAATQGDVIRVMLAVCITGSGATTEHLTDVSIDGVSTPILYKTANDTSQIEIAYIEFIKGISNVYTFSVSTTTGPGATAQFWLDAFTIDRDVPVHDVATYDTNGGDATNTLSVNTGEGGAVLVCFADANANPAGISVSGFEETFIQSLSSNRDCVTGWYLPVAMQTSATMTYQSGATPDVSGLAISFL